uniref:Uncharacterized protein n=1 Tax=Pseudictyota dubia TaxID=2749911 RepID=A0A7R9WA13_9STRA|mmetsp:Transcript_40790/g.75490  ORF Transcript_40790/g.75490 Transcript_40790/m.75490 type:complete len:273 (+) Transcript_40790:95-913(+)
MSSLVSKEETSIGSTKEVDEKLESEVTDGLTPKESSSGNGFFGVFKKSTNNVTTRKSRRSSSKKQQSSSVTSSTEEAMQQRKIVKAIKPPSGDAADAPTDATTATAEDAEVVDDKDIDRDAKRFALPGNAPSVEDATQQSMSEKAKKDRMDAAAAIKDEKKAKVLDEKRKAAATSIDGGADKGASTTVTKPKDSIFSVESERADQKRTVGSASLPVDAEPVEKKMKVGATGDEDETEGKSSTKSWLGGVKLVAVAAVVAVGAFVLLRAARKK